MKRLFLPTVLFLSAACQLGAELVPFAPPWDDVSSGPLDLRNTLPRPAGAAGFVEAREGHLWAGRERLRLFGVNFTAGACFLDHATADKVAARLARLGFNGVRLHFLDSTWGSLRLINYESGSSTNWNAEALDRLDYFVSRLRAEGVYVDLNLLVGRQFGNHDGVDARARDLPWKTAHAIGFFHAPHLAAQKQYAQQLLAHRNPYTGLAYAADPAICLVEINNENGLLHAWMGREFDDLPEPFIGDLTAQWNRWLARRYPTHEALFQAWKARREPLGAEQLRHDGFRNGRTGWNAEQHEGARVDVSAGGGVAGLHVRQAGSASWHVQFNHPGICLATNGLYTFTFQARADRPRRIGVSAMQAHEPWHGVGLQTDVDVQKEWTSYEFAFVSTGDTNARVGFTALNQRDARFEFRDVSLRPGGLVGVLEGASLEKRTMPVPKMAGARACSAEERADWVTFLWETERAHWREMRRFLREDLGVRAPVVGTIVGCSTPNLMAEMDAVDTHAYWQHPQFPGAQWDEANWKIRNISMVDHPSDARVISLAQARVAGKPHLVTEYDHPAPNVHASEGPLFVAAYGALQDWDAIFLYTYAHDDKRLKAGCIPGFFDIGQHPTVIANVPSASLLFRRADVAVARQCLSVGLTPASEIDLVARNGHAWDVLPTYLLGLPGEEALRHRIALDLTSAVRPAPSAAETNSFLSDTGELRWSVPATNQGVLVARATRTKFVIGHVDGQVVDLGHGVTVTVGATSNHWCTIALSVLAGEGFDGNPRRVLLTATGHAENQGMGWKNAERTTVGKDWGRPPSLVECIPATIVLPQRPGGKAPAVYALDAKGQRARPVAVAGAGKSVSFQIGPEFATLWYEIDYKD
jgi:hypothetical protein